jgi:pimeloyl-ACP methyl ester carboxylesterase
VIRQAGLVAAIVSIGVPGCSRGPWHDSSPHRVDVVAVDRDVRLEVLDWGGAGRPVVLLAGLGNTAHIFDDFAPRLAENFHVYGITRRGYGASSRPDSGYAADRLADDVLEVLDRLGLQRPALVGHSVAGEELSSVGSRHPERVAALVYLEAAYRQAYDAAAIPGEDPIPPPADNHPPQPPPPTEADRASFPALQAWCVRYPGFRPPEAELRQEFEATADGRVGRPRTPPDVERAILAGAGHYIDIRAPALAIYAMPHDQGPWVDADAAVRAAADLAAERDVRSTGAQAAAFERGVRGARVVRLSYANHYVFMSHEREVIDEIRGFLSKHD